MASETLTPEPEPETGTEDKTSPGGNFLTPEGVMMLSLAILIDAVEIIFLIISFFLAPAAPVLKVCSTIMEVIAFLTIGLWMWFRAGSGSGEAKTGKATAKSKMQSPQKTTKTLTEAAKWAKRIKWLRPLCMAVELLPIPLIGDLPLWTLAVYLELKYN